MDCKYLKQEMKTYQGWIESGIRSFGEYCLPDDEVDEEMVDYFMDILPPATFRADCAQVGEPHSCEPNDDGIYKNTYATFHRVAAGRWRFDGYCFRGCNENRVH